MKIKTAVCLLPLLALAGCVATKYECIDNACPSYYRAANQCLAQANSAFNQNKTLIWNQCMSGLGYVQKRCNPNENNNTPCQFIHVW